MNNISNIGNYEQAYLNESAESQSVGASAGTAEVAETDRTQDDRVSLSDASREMQIAEEAVAATADVQQEKVDEIKMAMESGEYEIAPEKIADKMIGAMINEMV